jgi:hypothetical protein
MNLLKENRAPRNSAELEQMILEAEQEVANGNDFGRRLALSVGFDPDNPGEMVNMFDANGKWAEYPESPGSPGSPGSPE